LAGRLPRPIHIMAFGDLGPGASAGIPLRSVTLAGGTATLQSMLTFARSQPGPDHPAHAGITRSDGHPVLVIDYDAPSPLGLFTVPGNKGT
jgi:hypothetical protein